MSVASHLKVSIVTISYNQCEFLERAIRSVLAQDYPEVEYIVVDPGSTDESRDIIEHYRSRISKLVLEPDKGPADGLNKGFSVATGEVFGYLNADDELLPGAISKAVKAFAVHPDADVIYGHGYKVDANGVVLRRLRSAPFSLWRYVYGESAVVQQSTFFRRGTFFDVGGFSAANRTCWDGELLVRFAQTGKRFRRVNEYWSLFRLYNDSITGSGRFEEQYRRDEARIFQEVIGRPAGARLDGLRSAVATVARWCLDPIAPLQRIVEHFCGPPAVRTP
jgi:glycosyltransferase involved in cell wall biosynthesis